MVPNTEEDANNKSLNDSRFTNFEFVQDSKQNDIKQSYLDQNNENDFLNHLRRYQNKNNKEKEQIETKRVIKSKTIIQDKICIEINIKQERNYFKNIFIFLFFLILFFFSISLLRNSIFYMI